MALCNNANNECWNEITHTCDFCNLNDGQNTYVYKSTTETSHAASKRVEKNNPTDTYSLYGDSNTGNNQDIVNEPCPPCCTDGPGECGWTCNFGNTNFTWQECNGGATADACASPSCTGFFWYEVSRNCTCNYPCHQNPQCFDTGPNPPGGGSLPGPGGFLGPRKYDAIQKRRGGRIRRRGGRSITPNLSKNNLSKNNQSLMKPNMSTRIDENGGCCFDAGTWYAQCIGTGFHAHWSDPISECASGAIMPDTSHYYNAGAGCYAHEGSSIEGHDLSFPCHCPGTSVPGWGFMSCGEYFQRFWGVVAPNPGAPGGGGGGGAHYPPIVKRRGGRIK